MVPSTIHKREYTNACGKFREDDGGEASTEFQWLHEADSSYLGIDQKIEPDSLLWRRYPKARMNVNLSVQEDMMYTVSIVSSKVAPAPVPRKTETSVQTEYADDYSEVSEGLENQVTESRLDPSIQELTATIQTMREEFATALTRKDDVITEIRKEMKSVTSTHEGTISIIVLYILFQVARVVLF